MITNEQKRTILNKMIEMLELPESAYEKAKNRYEDLGDWFDRDESTIKDNEPHIFPQGSFRLGTAIRPLDESEEYDLDLACKLRNDISKDSHTQKNLKQLIGQELAAYRLYRGIKKNLESKHRCWRLEYQDDLNFHMDIVPCIPADENQQGAIFESIYTSGLERGLSKSVSQTTVSITDDRHKKYGIICVDWKISNPEGYAKWFEFRMKSNTMIMCSERAQIDDIPLFKRKTVLQRSIQLLKRHRDNWSKDNPDAKPISIIITTLTSKAYNGEEDIVIALANILEKMKNLVNPSIPKVPNPVDPAEDFADRWYMEKYKYLNLEGNFFAWLKQAQVDFKHILSTTDTNFISEQAEQKFSLKINCSELMKQLNITMAAVNIITPKKHKIEKQNTIKPWGNLTK